MKSVYIINGSHYEQDLFIRFGWEIASSIESADLVLFTGGEDVDPRMYGDAKHHHSYCNINRDYLEKELYEEALSHKKAMAGICRGGQFLNVMNGGRMYQHVQGHTRSHMAYDETAEGKDKVLVTSTHHQMMMPPENAIILLTAKQKGEREWMDSQGNIYKDVSDEDIESVYFPDTNSLCFQPHPEYSREHGDAFSDMAKLFFKYIRNWSLT